MAEENFEEKAKEKARKTFMSTRQRLLQQKKETTFAQEREEIKPPSREKVIKEIPEEKKQEIRGLQTAEAYKDLPSKIEEVPPLAQKKALQQVKQDLPKETRKELREEGILQKAEKKAKLKPAEAYKAIHKQQEVPGSKIWSQPGGASYGVDGGVIYVDSPSDYNRLIRKTKEPGESVTEAVIDKSFDNPYVSARQKRAAQTPYESIKERRKSAEDYVKAEETDEYIKYKQPGTEKTFYDYSPEDAPGRPGDFYSLYTDYAADVTDKARTHKEWENLQKSWEKKTGQKEIQKKELVGKDVEIGEGQETFTVAGRRYEVPEETQPGEYYTMLGREGGLALGGGPQPTDKLTRRDFYAGKKPPPRTNKLLYTTEAIESRKQADKLIEELEGLKPSYQTEALQRIEGKETPEAITETLTLKQRQIAREQPQYFGAIPSATQLYAEAAATEREKTTQPHEYALGMGAEIAETAGEITLLQKPTPSFKEVGRKGKKAAAGIMGAAAGIISVPENIAENLGIDVTKRGRTVQKVLGPRQPQAPIAKTGFTGGATAAEFTAAYPVGAGAGKIVRGLGPIATKSKTISKAAEFITKHPKATKTAAFTGGTALDIAEGYSVYAKGGTKGQIAGRMAEFGAQELGFGYGFMKGLEKPPRLRYKRIKPPEGDEAVYGGFVYEKPGASKPLIGKARGTGIQIGTPKIAKETLEEAYGPSLRQYDRLLPGQTEARILRENLPVERYGRETLEESLDLTRRTAGRVSPYLDEADELPFKQVAQRHRIADEEQFQEIVEQTLREEDELMIGGSFSQKPQLGPYGRAPRDIDIKVKAPEEFQERLFRRLTGEAKGYEDITPQTFYKRGKGIATEKGHLFDIHGFDEGEYGLGRDVGLGYGFRKQPKVEIGGYRSLGAGEQVVRKGPHSALRLGMEGDELTVSPVAHRGKDVPDFLATQAALAKESEMEEVRKLARLWKKKGGDVPRVKGLEDISEETGEAISPQKYLEQKPSSYTYIKRPSYDYTAPGGLKAGAPSDKAEEVSYPSQVSPSLSISAPTPIAAPVAAPSPQPSKQLEPSPVPSAAPSPSKQVSKQPSIAVPSMGAPSPKPPSAPSMSIAPPSRGGPSSIYPSPQPSPEPSPTEPSPSYPYPSSPTTTAPPPMDVPELKLPEMKVDTIAGKPGAKYKPSLIAEFGDIEAEAEPELVTGFGIRPKTNKEFDIPDPMKL